MFRFSLRWLLLLVAFVAVGTVSLRYASLMISGGLSVAWLVFLMVAILGAIYRRRRQRAFWVGCCVFGWSFAAYGTVSGDKISAFDHVVQYAYNRISWNMFINADTSKALMNEGEHVFNSGTGTMATFPRKKPFLMAAETLIGFVIAISGGFVAQGFYATRDHDGVDTRGGHTDRC